MTKKNTSGPLIGLPTLFLKLPGQDFEQSHSLKDLQRWLHNEKSAFDKLLNALKSMVGAPSNTRLHNFVANYLSPLVVKVDAFCSQETPDQLAINTFFSEIKAGYDSSIGKTFPGSKGLWFEELERLIPFGQISNIAEKIDAAFDPDRMEQIHIAGIEFSQNPMPFVATLNPNKSASRVDVLEKRTADQKKELLALDEQLTKFSQVTNGLKKKFDALNEVQEERIKRTENARAALQEQLALEEASIYWTDKRSAHLSRLKWYCWGIAAWLTVSALVLSVVLEEYKESVLYAKNIYDLMPYLPGNILLIILVVWGARILVRLFLSENHLGTKSEEKAVLIKTYLALVNDGKASEEDRSIILSSIFSQTQDGIVEEDAMPKSGLFELLTKSK